MAKEYVKKPIRIQAIQLLREGQSIIDCLEFIFAIGMETSILGTQASVRQVGL